MQQKTNWVMLGALCVLLYVGVGAYQTNRVTGSAPSTLEWGAISISGITAFITGILPYLGKYAPDLSIKGINVIQLLQIAAIVLNMHGKPMKYIKVYAEPDDLTMAPQVIEFGTPRPPTTASSIVYLDADGKQVGEPTKLTVS